MKGVQDNHRMHTRLNSQGLIKEMKRVSSPSRHHTQKQILVSSRWYKAHTCGVSCSGWGRQRVQSQAEGNRQRQPLLQCSKVNADEAGDAAANQKDTFSSTETHVWNLRATVSRLNCHQIKCHGAIQIGSHEGYSRYTAATCR